MRLSQRIKQMRTDRPYRKWQMDELARWAESLEALVRDAYYEGWYDAEQAALRSTSVHRDDNDPISRSDTKAALVELEGGE